MKGKPEWFAVKIKSKSAFLVISKLKKIIQDHNLIVKSITIDNINSKNVY
nr:hypothetical protein [Mycoplasmopsis bovis]